MEHTAPPHFVLYNYSIALNDDIIYFLNLTKANYLAKSFSNNNKNNQNNKHFSNFQVFVRLLISQNEFFF
jgi:hypothetical protein